MRRRFALADAAPASAELMSDLAEARVAGFDALEIPDAKLEAYLAGGRSLNEFRAALAQAGLEPLNLSSRSSLRLAAGAEAAREALLDRCRALCTRAAAIGCPQVAVVPGWATNGRTETQIQARTVEALGAMSAVASDHGVRIGLELVGPRASGLRTLAAARGVIESVGDPAVGLIIDAFHFHASGSTWAMLDGLDPATVCFVRLADAPPVPLAQLREVDRLIPGDGAIALQTFVRILERAGYRGIYSTRVSGSAYRTWQPRRLARAARESLAALFAELDEVEGRLD